MKSQHRHELQTNELADRLGRYMQAVAPYSRQIALAVVVIAVVATVGLFLWSRQSARAAAGWSDYFLAIGQRDPDALAEVAREYEGRMAGLWAQHAAGDVLLATGARQMFSDREEADRSLRDAEKHFLAVEQAARDEMLLNRARYGLAQVYETLGQLDRAREYYGKVTERDAALSRSAQRRLERLSSESIERWYAWFERQEPPRPQGETAPQVSPDLDLLPARPDISLPGLPGLPGLPLSPEEGGLPLEPPLSAPQPGTEPPATPTEPQPGTEPQTPDETTPAAPQTPDAETQAEQPRTEPPAPAEPKTPAEPETPDAPGAVEPAPLEPAPADDQAEPAMDEPETPADESESPTADAEAPVSEPDAAADDTDAAADDTDATAEEAEATAEEAEAAAEEADAAAGDEEPAPGAP